MYTEVDLCTVNSAFKKTDGFQIEIVARLIMHFRTYIII